MKVLRHCCAIGACLLAGGAAELSLAQTTHVETDGSLPGREATTLSASPSGEFEVGEDLGFRPGDGPSLIHSFARFDVGANDTVLFRAARPTRQIVSRVTGGVPSSIFGTLRTAAPGADLYLINPSGVVFGPGARLDVEGSFFATSAARLVAETGEILSADPRAPLPILRFDSVAGFGFFDRAAPISVDGALLEVGTGATLGLSGGDLDLRATALLAPAGRVSLVGDRVDLGDRTVVSTIEGGAGRGAGAIEIAADTLRIAGRSVLGAIGFGGADAGSISIVASASVELGERSLLDVSTDGAGGAPGRIEIVSPALSVTDGAALLARGLAGAAGGTLDLQAEAFALRNGAGLDVTSTSTASAGRVVLRAGSVEIEGAAIDARSVGRAGSIDLEARETVVLRDGGDLLASTVGGGRAGSVRIRAAELALDGGPAGSQRGRAEISAIGFDGGRGGDIDIVTDEAVRLDADTRIDASAFGGADAGSISIDTGALRLGGSSDLFASGVGGSSGGRISIVADSIAAQRDLHSTIGAPTAPGFVSVSAAGAGASAGRIELQTGSLLVDDGLVFQAVGFESAAGGRISIDARERIELGGNAMVDVTGLQAGSAAGAISLRAPKLALSDGALLFARGLQGAAGGDIDIEVDALDVASGATIQTLVERDSRAGNITIHARERVDVDGASIDSSAESGATGRAGDIRIETPRLSVRGGFVFARGRSGAQAGTVAISADAIDASLGGAISASGFGESGRAGRVEIVAQDVRLDGMLSATRRSGISARGGLGGTPGQIWIEASTLRLSNGAALESTGAGRIEVVSDVIDLASGALVSVSTREAGETSEPIEGGTIDLHAGQITLDGGAMISADRAEEGRAGNIVLRADQIMLDGAARIASIGSSGAASGDIALFADSVSLAGQSDVIVVTDGAGQGGRISADVRTLSLIGGSNFNASARAGGSIDIRASERIDISNVGGAPFELPVILDRISRGLAVDLSGVFAVAFGAPAGERVATASDLAPGIRLFAKDVNITDGAFVAATSFGDRSAGAVEIGGERISLLAGGAIDSSTLGSGVAGSIKIDASESLLLRGVEGQSLPSRVRSITAASGRAGTIDISAPDVILDRGVLATSSVPTFLDASTGAGGRISVDADRIALRNGGRIDGSTFSDAPGGGIEIRARERLQIDGRGSAISASTGASGVGGNVDVRVSAGALVLRRGGVIESASGIDFAESRIAPDLGDFDRVGPGPAEGAAGRVSVVANRVEIADAAAIRSSASGPGAAGAVDVRAVDVSLASGGRISTTALLGSSSASTADGRISVDAERRIRVGAGAAITASVVDGRGGDVVVRAGESIVLDAGSSILAQAEGTTPDVFRSGGRIELATRAFVGAVGSVVSADAGQGVAGTVLIDSPEVSVDESADPPPIAFFDAGALFGPRCATRSAEDVGSLVVAARSGIPPSPEGLLIAFDAGEGAPQSGARSLPEVGAGPGEGGTLGAGAEVAKVLADARGAFRGGSLERAETLFARAASLTDDTSAARADVLRGLSQAHQARGRFAESAAALTSAVQIAEAAEDRLALIAALDGLGNALIASSRPEAAREILLRAQTEAEAARDLESLARIANHLGNMHVVLAEPDAAVRAYARSAASASSASLPDVEATARSNAARAWLGLGDLARARAELDLALVLARALPEHRGTASLWVHLGVSQRLASVQVRAPDEPREALLRASHRSLSTAAELARRVSAPRIESFALGNLGALYAQEGHWSDAARLSQLALLAAERADAPDAAYRWHAQHGRVLWRQGNAQASLDAYRRAVALLEELRPETAARYAGADSTVRDGITPIYQELAAALIDSSELVERAEDARLLLAEARTRFQELRSAELREYFRDECVAALEAKSVPVDTVSPTTAVLYPIVLPDRLELLVSLGARQKRVRVDVPQAQLERVAEEFQRLVKQSESERYLRPAWQLYDWLVRPLEADLRAAEIDTLVFIPSAGLRIPLAALHDGESFLIEHYAVVTNSGLAVTDPRPLDLAAPRVLLAGLSQPVEDLPPLSHVPRELRAIEQRYGGELLLDDAFTRDALEQRMREREPSIVHLATHFQLRSDSQRSFLASSDGRITIDDLGSYVGAGVFRERPLEMLVVSACDTASGRDDSAALGLIGLAVRAGARSAVGSLWAVNDEATATLMDAFYEALRHDGTSRARALREAQRKLLDNRALAHPFYWSAFLLISNWL